MGPGTPAVSSGKARSGRQRTFRGVWGLVAVLDRAPEGWWKGTVELGGLLGCWGSGPMWGLGATEQNEGLLVGK